MRQFILRLIDTFRPKTADEDLAREVAAHLALLEDEYRRRGHDPNEARLAARRAIGSVAHANDLHRDARSFVWLDDVPDVISPRGAGAHAHAGFHRSWRS